MNQYRNIILNRLLDKHQGGERGFEEGKSRTKIRINVQKDSCLDDYRCEDSYLYRPDIEEAAKRLEREGMVLLEWDKKTELLKGIILTDSPDRIDEAYQKTGHVRKKSRLNEETDFLLGEIKKTKQNTVKWNYIHFLMQLLSEHKSHLTWYKNIDDLKEQLQWISGIETNEEEILLRNFSVRNFNDSKVIERNSSKILSIFAEFSTKKYESIEEIYADYSILKNPAYVYLKQGLEFRIRNQVINLDDYGEDFALSDEAIENMTILKTEKKKVITIENLTTFHYFRNADAIIIYLAGYHSLAKRELLNKIYHFNPNLSFYHIGDIDWGGFRIFLDLKEKTKIPFSPMMMGIEELEQHKKEWKKLSENDRHKLNMLLSNTEAELFKDVIKYMLKNNCKLEQEALDF